jgi:hypothetical protein
LPGVELGVRDQLVAEQRVELADLIRHLRK